MGELARLLELSGRWRGNSKLWFGPDELSGESASSAIVSAVAKGKFVRVDYDWAHDGVGHEGSILIGVDKERGVATGIFVDSFHMGDKVMICEGEVREDGTAAVTGSYAAPPDRDWGWRIEVGEDRGALAIRMFNISPEGEGHVAVEGIYRRQQ
jgi:hypothetical protein